MGLSKRFGDFKYSYIPGPGMYKLKGFADDVVLRADKAIKNKKKLQEKHQTLYSKKSASGAESNIVSEMMEMLENENDQEYQNAAEENTTGHN
jgi:hypothetical protein